MKATKRQIIFFICLLISANAEAFLGPIFRGIGKSIDNVFREAPTPHPAWETPKPKPDPGEMLYKPKDIEKNFILPESFTEIDDDTYKVFWTQEKKNKLLHATNNQCRRNEARKIGEDAINESEVIRKMLKHSKAKEYALKKALVYIINHKLVPKLGVERVKLEFYSKTDNSVISQNTKIAMEKLGWGIYVSGFSFSLMSMCGYEVSYRSTGNRIGLTGARIKGADPITIIKQ